MFVIDSEAPIDELRRRILYLEMRGRSRMSEWLELIAAFDDHRGHRETSHSSTASWLAHACGIDSRTARDHVRVARRLVMMPTVARAFQECRLSYAKVRALTRAHAIEDERELLRVALISSASQLERHVRQLRSAASADLDVANRGRARRFVRTFWDEDGSLRFFGRLPADDGAAVLEAIEAKASQLHGENGDPCCPDGWSRAPIGARRADALTELVTGGGCRTEVVLHADLEALACTAQGEEPRGGKLLHLRDGPAIPSETARRLACDCRITTDHLNLGRTTRLVTPALRRALEGRDGRVCSMPGCERTHGLEAHHIQPWEHGGCTDLPNLRLVCSYRHHSLHEGGFRLRRRRDGTLVIKDPRGRELYELPSRASPGVLAAA